MAIFEMKVHTKWTLVAVLALSLLVRLAYFKAYSERLDALVVADAKTHVMLASNLLNKGIYGPDAPWSYRPPLYPIFLAGTFGLLGEYIGRIYAEVRKRPRYVIRNVYTCGEDCVDK